MKSLSKFDARFDRGVQVSIDFLFELRNITDIQRSKIHRQLRSKNGRADALRFIRRKIREYITLKKNLVFTLALVLQVIFVFHGLMLLIS